MTFSVSRDNKQQLLQDLEQLHSELAQGPGQKVDPIPVLVEAVLDEDDLDPDLDLQMNMVDDLLVDDDDMLISDDMKLELPEDFDIETLEATAMALALAAAKTPSITPKNGDKSAASIKSTPAIQLDLGYEITMPSASVPEAKTAYAPKVQQDSHNIETQKPPVMAFVPLALEPVLAALQPVNTPGQDENPFLPAHLREKLRHSKAVLMEEIQRSNDSVNASSALLKAYSGDNLKTRDRSQPRVAPEPNVHQQMIDALVAQYLPIIEQELRKRLAESLQSSPNS